MFGQDLSESDHRSEPLVIPDTLKWEDMREKGTCVRLKNVRVSDLGLDTWVNSPGHLELLIDFSCDQRASEMAHTQ